MIPHRHDTTLAIAYIVAVVLLSTMTACTKGTPEFYAWPGNLYPIGDGIVVGLWETDFCESGECLDPLSISLDVNDTQGGHVSLNRVDEIADTSDGWSTRHLQGDLDDAGTLTVAWDYCDGDIYDESWPTLEDPYETTNDGRVFVDWLLTITAGAVGLEATLGTDYIPLDYPQCPQDPVDDNTSDTDSPAPTRHPC